MTPDPAGLAAVDPTNPQSWNRYSYALNNPVSNTDPTGLFCIYMTDDGGSVESIDYGSDTNECAGTGGTWQDPSSSGEFEPCMPGAICVDANGQMPSDAGSDGNGFSQWASDFLSSFNQIDPIQLSVRLNRCAASKSNQLYSKLIGKGTLANIFLGNTFAAGSQLALGPSARDRGEGGAAIGLAGPQYPAGNIVTQILAQDWRISVLGGTQIAAVPGSEIMLGGQVRFATEVSRYTAIAAKDTPAFASVLGAVASVFDFKLVADGITYLEMETSCALGE